MKNNDFHSALVKKLLAKLESKKEYQDRQYSIYNGKYQPRSLGFALPLELENALIVNLDWGKTTVEYVANMLKFDCLSGDSAGAQALLDSGNAASVFSSAITNSLIGACAFVAVSPGKEVFGEPPVVFTPFAGYEATAIFNSRTGKLDAGLAIESYQATSGSLTQEAKTWLLFMPEATYRVYRDPKKPLEKLCDSRMGTQLIPFVFGQDLASKPFGTARVNRAALTILDSGIRAMKRSQIASEFYSQPFRYILSQTDGADSSVDSWSGVMGQILEMSYSEGQEKPTVGQLAASSPEPFEKEIRMYAGQFAASQMMLPTEFGVDPSNGSLSSEAEAARSKKMRSLVKDSQQVYGAAIKQVALHALSLMGEDITSVASTLQVEWLNCDASTDIGAVGDAIGKLFAAVPELQKTDIAYEILGLSKRSKLVNSAQNEKFLQKTHSIELSKELEDLISERFAEPDNLIEGNELL